MKSRRKNNNNHIVSNHSTNSNLYNFQAKNKTQKDFIRSICENIITIGYGFSGTGKSMCSIAIACQKLKKGIIKNIVVAKPIICCDNNNIGSLPGTIDEKIHPYMYPVLEYFEYFLGKQNCISLLNRTINLFPIELIRGHTYNDSIMILEESQNCTINQIKLFLSRIGQNSKIILIGDNKQSDIGHNNGLQFCIDKLKNIKNVNVIEFTKFDVLRNEIIPQIMEVFNESNNSW